MMRASVLQTHRTAGSAASVLTHFWYSAAHQDQLTVRHWWGAVFIYSIGPCQYALITVDHQTGPAARDRAEREVRAEHPDASALLGRELFHDGTSRDTALRTAGAQ